MKREIITIGVVVVVVVNLFGCSFSKTRELKDENTASVSKEGGEGIGTPNPAAVYCVALGYEYEIIEDDKGGQYGVCIFPDNSECSTWAFYRGKCGQEWSYCKRQGYDLKDLGRWEGIENKKICKNTCKTSYFYVRIVCI